MGVLAIHAGYADYFFPGTSVLQTRPRYLFFACWNFLWLARQRGVTTANFLRRKDEAELWVTRQLVATRDRALAPGDFAPNMDGIIGVRVEVIEGAVGLDPPVANLLAVAAIHCSEDGHAGEEVGGIGCAQCGLIHLRSRLFEGDLTGWLEF